MKEPGIQLFLVAAATMIFLLRSCEKFSQAGTSHPRACAIAYGAAAGSHRFNHHKPNEK